MMNDEQEDRVSIADAAYLYDLKNAVCKLMYNVMAAEDISTAFDGTCRSDMIDHLGIAFTYSEQIQQILYKWQDGHDYSFTKDGEVEMSVLGKDMVYIPIKAKFDE